MLTNNSNSGETKSTVQPRSQSRIFEYISACLAGRHFESPVFLGSPPPSDSTNKPRLLWFCSRIPSPPPEELPCIGVDDVIPNPKDQHFYDFSAKPEPDQAFPKSAIFIRDTDSKKSGYILPNEAQEKVKKLIFRINGRHTFELEDPFGSGGLSSTDLWWHGEVKGNLRDKVLKVMEKLNMDISRVDKIEMTGFYAKPIELTN